MNWLDTFIQSIPGVAQLNGTKTALGALSLAIYIALQIDPALQPVVAEVLKYLGITLIPIGVAHKVAKAGSYEDQ